MISFIHALDLAGVAVFAASGALVASRKEMDPVGFGLMASVAGVGGGTLRDVLLDRPVFWIADWTYVAVCLGVAVATFFTAHLVQRRFVMLLWVDAVGLAAYAVMGAELARVAGASPIAAIVLGVMTATFGGLIRDVLGNEIPLILRKEVYATAAALAAGVHIILATSGFPPVASALFGMIAGFAVRAGGITLGWSLPRYRPRAGREYPPE